MRVTRQPRPRPKAYTLIELLIVISIIVVVVGIAAALWPSMRSSTKTVSAADQIQGLLTQAKARAARDRRPTGVRLIPDPNNPTAVTQLVLIQQPDPFTGPVVDPAAGVMVPGQVNVTNGATVTFSGVDFFGGIASGNPTDYPVQPGDYLEVNGGGPLARITAVPDSRTLVLLPTHPITVAAATPNYRILRQPRVLVGEEPLALNSDVIIDLAPNTSLNVPTRNGLYEILFSPSGGVVGSGTSSGDKIILWVRDGGKPQPTDGEPVLLGIQVRTGMVAGYLVDKISADPYHNTRDPHATGL